MNSQNALSTVAQVLEAADRFFLIADMLHRRLNGGPIGTELGQPPANLYGLLVEEYGLRNRAAILRNDAAAHVVLNTTIGQADFLEVLGQAGATIARLEQMVQLRSVIAGVSTLCVGISPGNGRVVDFLAAELTAGIERLNSACLRTTT